MLEENSGSITHRIQGVAADQVTTLRRAPGEAADNMAAWLILAEVDGLAGGTALSVVLEDE